MQENDKFNKLVSLSNEEVKNIFSQMSLKEIDELLTYIREVEEND